MNENELPDALRAAVPPRPSTRGWAATARSRARTRRAGVAAAAVVAVAALAAPLALQFISPPSVVLATPSPQPSVAVPLVPDACDDPLTGALPLVDGDLPDGATSLWLCGRSDTGASQVLVGAPDPLVAHAAEAVAAFNALDKSEGVLDCMPNPLDYTVVVEYPDGAHRSIRIAGCGDLRDTTNMFETFRGDGAGYLAQLRELWKAEREQTSFTYTGTDSLCSTAPASVYRPLDPADLTRAVTCRADGTVVDLDADLTADLLDAIRGGSGLSGTDERGEIPLPDLVLLTPGGDPVSLHRDAGRGAGLYWWDDGTQRRFWGPLAPALEARIVEAQGPDGGPTPTTPSPVAPLPDERGEGLVSTVCDAIQSGDLTPQDLPATEDLPDGVARVWLCGDKWETFGGVGPIEPLTTEPDRVVEAVNSLPAANFDACTEMGGLTFHLALDYPDGTRRVVSAETVNCEWVGGWGSRTGGAQLLQDLLPMWTAQRDEKPMPFTDDVDLCTDAAAVVGLNSVATVERGSLYRGFVCGLPSDAADGDGWIQRELPGDLVLALSQATAVPEDSWSIPEGSPYLVLYNQYGDPVTYPVDQDLRIRIAAGSWVYEGAWTPDGDLAASWAELLSGLRGGTP
ncbi:hypothetical protein [Tessaracoccus sp. Z1128]